MHERTCREIVHERSWNGVGQSREPSPYFGRNATGRVDERSFEDEPRDALWMIEGESSSDDGGR
jgi:hypothetical protein